MEDQEEQGMEMRARDDHVNPASPGLNPLKGQENHLGFLSPQIRRQIFSVIAAASGSMGLGCLLGYTSPAGPQLMSGMEAGGLGMTTEEYSWFASCFNFGAIAGCVLAALGMTKFGGRFTLIAAAPLYLAGSLAVALGWSYWVLVCGRVAEGVTVGVVSTAAPPYIAEVASPHIRGALGMFFTIMLTSGVLFTFLVGIFVGWRWLAVICALPSLTHFLLLVFVATTLPSTLVSKGKIHEAHEVLRYLRGEAHDVLGEVEEVQRLQSARRQTKAIQVLPKPHVLRPLLLAIALMFFLNASGVQAITLNMVTIFRVSGAGISEDLSSVVVGLVQVLATAAGGVILDRTGRRRILIFIMPCIILSLASLGLYFHLWGTEGEEEGPPPEGALTWLPLAALLLFFPTFAISLGSVPWVLMGEFFPPEIAEVTAPMVSCSFWINSFVSSYIYFPLRKLVGDAGMFWTFSCITVVGWIFVIVLVPETKGKTLQEIAAHFATDTTTQENKNKNTNGSLTGTGVGATYDISTVSA